MTFPEHSPERNSTVNAQATFLYKEFENNTFRITAISPKGQCIKVTSLTIFMSSPSPVFRYPCGGAAWLQAELCGLQPEQWCRGAGQLVPHTHTGCAGALPTEHTPPLNWPCKLSVGGCNLILILNTQENLRISAKIFHLVLYWC